MWVRKRIDISWADLAHGLTYCFMPAPKLSTDLNRDCAWIPAPETVSCYSVRSGLDLLLTALALPPGSEVILSAVNIPDIAAIVEQHGLHVVPVDLDEQTLLPSVESIAAEITPATKIILVAHLFGTRSNLAETAKLAQKHQCLLVEDAAQAFIGNGYSGDDNADITMFSFGPIKTATALGGAVLRVRDSELRKRVLQQQKVFPKQPRFAYAKRLMKYTVLKFISQRWIYAGVVKILGLMQRDLDQFVQGQVRNLGSHEKLFKSIQQQPSTPLLRLMWRRVNLFQIERIEARRLRGKHLDRITEEFSKPLLCATGESTYWVYPYKTDRKQEVIQQLRENGFDASDQSSLVVLSPTSKDRSSALQIAHKLLKNIIFLPAYAEMPMEEMDRLASVLVPKKEPLQI